MTIPSIMPHRSWPCRYTVIGLCFCSTFICYIDRVNIPVAIIPMAGQFGWDEMEKGLVIWLLFATGEKIIE